MTDERRTSPRHTASLAGELETPEGKSAIAITRDVSAGGLSIYTRMRECGDTLKLMVLFGGEKLLLSGKVVRQEPVEDSELWRTKVALAVDTSDPAIAKLFAALAAQESSSS